MHQHFHGVYDFIRFPWYTKQLVKYFVMCIYIYTQHTHVHRNKCTASDILHGQHSNTQTEATNDLLSEKL